MVSLKCHPFLSTTHPPPTPPPPKKNGRQINGMYLTFFDIKLLTSILYFTLESESISQETVCKSNKLSILEDVPTLAS